ncbi:MAG: hypothetical protein PHF66_09945 [Desulfobacteraceae bacterium]|jgi:hypothetical protein|nr:hypothetical protein [Desulfobacteraceae bacterium]MDD3993032.1 hypothetical protein [Desulfobacteraceae bacterium]
MEPVGVFLDVCRLARKQTHRNLTVFALMGEQVLDPDYLLLETALEEGLVEVRELGPEGSVPELGWSTGPSDRCSSLRARS